MNLLSQLLASKGITSADVSKNSKLGRHFGGEPVGPSADLDRIEALPRRRWQDSPDIREQMSSLLRQSGGKETLFHMQACVLKELYELRRCNGVADLGAGKTHPAALAGTILGIKRAAFLNYSRLMEKTRREFDEISINWKVFRDYDFLTVEKLSLSQYADWFETYLPELIVIDEAQAFAAPHGARFKRLRRYKVAHPDTVILLLTGTPGSDSLNQYAHLQALLHGSESPLPLDEHELMLWCEATDAHVRGGRRPPGVLGSNLETAREWVGRRVEETEGNIYHRVPEGVNCSLFVDSTALDSVSDEMERLCNSARRNLELPDGRSFEELYDVGLILKQLGCGFAKVLDPAPPPDWKEARGLVGTYVREIIRQEDLYRMDTPGQVVKAIRSGQLDDGGLWDQWKEIEPTFTPEHKTEWFDDSVVTFCKEWLKEHKGLVWTTLPTFGRRLAEASGLPFFHALGVDKVVGSIETYPGGTGAILALRPNMLGRNLQNRWHKNLFVTPPASATEIDQAIGRTVRTGQKAPTVEVTFLFTVWENYECVQKARTRAETDRTLGRNQASRLVIGDWIVKEPQGVGARWKK